MSYLWGMINALQLITILSLISINVPGLPAVINNIIMTFVQMNILPSAQIVAYVIP